ncbi:MFS transporter [Marmoricola sp. Leaf446]|uniref:MFS transporter n=1 Tax=Marmoricola sp. Leaf446 TaxID=1736379 RepID=UPI000AAD18AB|nr:MFS transporter [Marmoricola sp. Leaf446]
MRLPQDPSSDRTGDRTGHRARHRPRHLPRGLPRGLPGVLAVLMTAGWAANLFASVIPVLAEQEGFSTALLDAAFGAYAIALLPGLFGGGALSDRVGRAWVVLPGAGLVVAGTVVLMAFHDPAGLLVGRLVVGLGAGLTFGAGTAWAGDLGAATGTVLAGVFLTTGFAVGPLVSGALAQLAPAPLVTPFVLSIALSLAAIGWAAATSAPASRRLRDAGGGPVPTLEHHDARTALAWSLPVGVLVFASVALSIVTLPTRLPPGVDGPLLVGVAAALALGSGIAVQTVARARSWGPGAGVAGALTAAAGFALVALAGERIALPLFALSCVVLGTAYGLCLREGLLDVETLAPPARRGTLTGTFYVATYVGFGLPLMLTSLQPVAGTRLPVLVLALAALLVAGARRAQLRGGHPGRSAPAGS